MALVYDETNPSTWGLDPLFHVHVKLPLSSLARMRRARVGAAHARAADAVRLLSFAGGVARPVRRVQVAGRVVHARATARLTELALDDASGALGHVVVWRDAARRAPDAPPRLGDFVHAVGRLDWRSGEPEVRADALRTADDPHAELLWWMDVRAAHEAVYFRDPATALQPGSRAGPRPLRPPKLILPDAAMPDIKRASGDA